MLRAALAWLVPLLIPTAAWLVYVLLTGRRQPGWVRRGPWLRLLGGGVALSLATLGAFALFGGSEPGQVYVPPRIEDGRVVAPETLPQGAEPPAATPGEDPPPLPAAEATGGPDRRP